MVSYALIQSKVSYGYRKVAQTVGGGALYQQFRPTTAINPLSQAVYATVQAIFSQDKALSFAEPADYDTPSWFGALDSVDIAASDYFVGQQGTFFIASTAPESPFSAPRCVLTNHSLTVLSQPLDSGAVGALGYGGDIGAAEVALMTGWPASVLETQRAQTGDVRLPGDEPMAWYDVLLPAYAGVTLTQNDVLTDETGRRYRLSAVEITELGWRMRAVATMT